MVGSYTKEEKKKHINKVIKKIRVKSVVLWHYSMKDLM